MVEDGEAVLQSHSRDEGAGDRSVFGLLTRSSSEHPVRRCTARGMAFGGHSPSL